MANKTTVKQTSKATKATGARKAEAAVEWLSATSPISTDAFITLDNQQRLYFNANTRQLVDNATEFYVGYDAGMKALIVLPSRKARIVGVKPFRLDARSYSKAHALVERLRIDTSSLPMHYDYVGERETGDGTAYVFQLRK